MIVNSKDEPRAISESSVVARVKINDFTLLSMFDSGAQPSIIDKGTISSLGVNFAVFPSRIHGVGEILLGTLGKAQLVIDLGQKNLVNHEFHVLILTYRP